MVRLRYNFEGSWALPMMSALAGLAQARGSVDTAGRYFDDTPLGEGRGQRPAAVKAMLQRPLQALNLWLDLVKYSKYINCPGVSIV